MKPTGHAYTEALSGTEEDEGGEGAKDKAGEVRVERGVRPMLVACLIKVIIMV